MSATSSTHPIMRMPKASVAKNNITAFTCSANLISALLGVLSLPVLGMQTSDAQDAATALALPEITVTSEHRDQALLRTPSTIDVMNAEQLAAQQMNTLRDISGSSANLLIQPAETYKTITIRGVGGGGRNVGFDARVGVYIDGVYMGQGMALDSPIYDIDQIEVLKGPQGYLFGNGSNAGAINIMTKQPSHQSEKSMAIGVGNIGYIESTLKLNGSLSEKLTGRLVMHSEDNDGFVRNQFNGEQLKQLWGFSTRGQLKLEATDQLDLRLVADYSKRRPDTYMLQGDSGMFGQPLNAPAVFDQVDVNDAPNSVVEVGGVQLNADYFFENDAQLTAIVANRYTQNKLINDNDYSRDDILHAEFKDTTQQLSQELRYTSADNIAWPYVLGVYFLQQDGRNQRQAFLGEDLDTLVTIPGVGAVPFGAAFGVNPGAIVGLDGRVQTDTQAIYTNIKHQFADAFTLHLGARYSIEGKALDFSIDGSQSANLGIATLDEKRTLKQRFLSPMAGLSYQLNGQSHVYAKFSRAYKSGGWNVEFLNTAQVADGFEYAPERVNAYELGYKYHDPKTQFDLAVFVNHYKDYQVFQFADLGANTLALQLRNAASVKSQGLEVGLKHLLTSQWEVDANIAYLDARYQQFPNGSTNGSDASGQALPDAPKWSGALTVKYQSRLGVLPAPMQLSLQNQFQSDIYSGISNDPISARLPGRHIVNASIAYTTPSKQWQLTAWVRNLTDKVYTLAKGIDFLGNGMRIYARPRTYGVNASYHF